MNRCLSKYRTVIRAASRDFSNASRSVGWNEARKRWYSRQSAGTKTLVRSVVFLGVATPCIAIAQGVEMLADYRTNHADTPVPPMPQHGVVVAEDAMLRPGLSKSQRRKQQNRPPLRLLVIGDSLAAGVGMSKSGTPALPISIARGISQACGGRVVYWTCVGSPGVSASQLVADINNMSENRASSLIIQNRLESLVKEWEAKRRRWQERQAIRRRQTQEQRRIIAEQTRLQQRMDSPISFESNKNFVRQWWTEVGQSSDKIGTTRTFITDRWKKIRSHLRSEVEQIQHRVKEDIDDIKTIVQTPQLEQQDTLLQQQMADGMEAVNSQQFDVAIVLTGLNDIKDSYMPGFMVNGRNSSLQEGTEYISGGWYVQLLMVLKALNPHMSDPINFDRAARTSRWHQEGQHPDRSRHRGVADDIQSRDRDSDGSNQHGSHGTSFPKCSTEPFFNHENMTTSSATEGVGCNDVNDGNKFRSLLDTDNVPSLVVFPELPVNAAALFQKVPLKWFLVPLFNNMESHKERLAEEFSDHVLFIRQPPLKFWEEAAAGKGAIWDNLRREKLLLTLNSMAQEAKERVQAMMKEHRLKWEQRHQQKHSGQDDGVAESGTPRRNSRNSGDAQSEGALNDLSLMPSGKLRDSASTSIKGSEDEAAGDQDEDVPSLVSIDNLHPSDEGYEIWGRMIAGEIVNHWMQR